MSRSSGQLERSVGARGQAFLGLVDAAVEDLRTPVRNARQGIEWLREPVGGDETAGEALAFIDQSLHRLEETVDVLVRFGRVLAVAADRDELDLATVVTGAARRARARSASSGRPGAAPEVSARPPLGRALGDRHLLEEALVQLLDNAGEYRHPARPPVVTVTGRTEGHHTVVLCVADNASGIEPAYVERVFGPLVRLHPHHEHPGAGMGLALARAAVEAQRGSLDLVASSGSGSTFEIRLPAVGGDRRATVSSRWGEAEG